MQKRSHPEKLERPWPLRPWCPYKNYGLKGFQQPFELYYFTELFKVILLTDAKKLVNDGTVLYLSKGANSLVAHMQVSRPTAVVKIQDECTLRYRLILENLDQLQAILVLEL